MKLYKKWWFWLFAVVILLIIITAANSDKEMEENPQVDEDSPQPTVTSPEFCR